MIVMKRLFVAVLLFALAAVSADSVKAQQTDTKYIEFTCIKDKKHKPVTSLYNKLVFMDSREDSSAIGILDSGFRRVVRAAVKTPLEPQLMDVLQGHLAPNSGDGELLFQLRRLSFAETSGTRYCYTVATVYAHRGDKYGQVYSTDFVLNLTEPSQLYGNLKELENVIINDLLLRSMVMPPNDTLWFDLNGVRHVAGSVITKADGSIDKLKFEDRKWKEEEHAHIYAVVYKGKPFVVTRSGYYPLEKRRDDFYFTGKLRINATAGEKAVGQLAVGMIGNALVSNAGDKNVYQVLIDHQTGEFVHLKVLEEMEVE